MYNSDKELEIHETRVTPRHVLSPRGRADCGIRVYLRSARRIAVSFKEHNYA